MMMHLEGVLVNEQGAEDVGAWYVLSTCLATFDLMSMM